MSIASRIEAIEQHLTDDYSVLTLAGADLTGVNKNIVNLKMSWKERLLYFMNNGTSVVWNNWTKVSGTGTTLSLNNTEEAPMSLTYKGNTSQSGTPTPSSPQDIHTVSGNNTITISNSDNTQSSSYPINLGVENLAISSGLSQQTINGVTFTPVYEDSGLLKYIVINGTASARADYKLPYTTYAIGNYINQCITSANDGNITTLLVKRSGVAVGGTSTSQTFLLEEITEMQYWVRINTNATINNVKVYPMLEKGSTAHQYTPYGRTPLELNKISTYQDYIRKSTGKNLCSGTDIIAQIITFNIDKDRLGKTFTLSFTTNVALTSNSVYFVADGTSLGNVGTISGTGKITQAYTITDTMYNSIKSANEVVLRIYKSGATFTQPTDAIIANGTYATLEYEPYGTSWYKYSAIGKVVLNGSESWGTLNVGGGGNKRTEHLLSNAPTQTAPRTNVFCNYFKFNDSYSTDYIGACFISESKLFVYPEQQDDVSNFKTWLSTHNTTVYYPLATPTYTEITDTTLINQLEALKKSYEGQTNISQVNNDLPFELDVTALGELE